MEFADQLNYLLNFMAPAWVVGLLLALFAPFIEKKRFVARVLCAQAAINSIAGVAALAVGLWFFGRDGKMASYGAMVLVGASSQWALSRR